MQSSGSLYLPQVKYATERIHARLPRSIEIDDLYNMGILMLIKAFEHFDPKQGTKFETYCPHHIEGSIRDGLRKNDWILRQV
ncbi:MAG TPA: sigma factor [Anaerohalosphaeraceae bacterium]|nr:sigma factor [Anaerohalosphaeraceae bacterium]